MLGLSSIYKDFTINNMKKKTGLKVTIIFFSVDLNPIDNNEMLNIYRCLMKGT